MVGPLDRRWRIDPFHAEQLGKVSAIVRVGPSGTSPSLQSGRHSRRASSWPSAVSHQVLPYLSAALSAAKHAVQGTICLAAIRRLGALLEYFGRVFNGLTPARRSWHAFRNERCGRDGARWNKFSTKLLHPGPSLRCGAEDGRRRFGGRRSMARARGVAGFLRNPRPQPCQVGGVSQMSVRATAWALDLVPLDMAYRDLVSHSFAFFTGLCEMDRAGAASLALLAGRYK